jgi:hypothetical protein
MGFRFRGQSLPAHGLIVENFQHGGDEIAAVAGRRSSPCPVCGRVSAKVHRRARPQGPCSHSPAVSLLRLIRWPQEVVDPASHLVGPVNRKAELSLNRASYKGTHAMCLPARNFLQLADGCALRPLQESKARGCFSRSWRSSAFHMSAREPLPLARQASDLRLLRGHGAHRTCKCGTSVFDRHTRGCIAVPGGNDAGAIRCRHAPD